VTYVPLHSDVGWLNECYPVDHGHEHVSSYLLGSDDSYVLIDSGSYRHRDSVLQDISDVTDGAGVDALILSHPDLPHSGNIRAVQERWPDVEIVSFTSTPSIHCLSDVTSLDKGTTERIAGRTFRFIDPPLLDVPSTAWTYDNETGTLFTIDGFGLYHHETGCDTIFDTETPNVDDTQLYEFHLDALRWLQYVKPDRLHDALTVLFEELEVHCIAPTHGNPVLRPAIDPYLRTVFSVITRIADEFTPPRDGTDERPESGGTP
jgi:flavorubredoxin